MADRNAPGAGDAGREGVSSGKELGSNTAITTKTQGWRDWLAVHEAAEMFPLMSGSPLDRLRFLAATVGELMGFAATQADAPSLFEVA